MTKVIATIEETVVDTFEFEIEDGEDAIEIAIEKYNKGELILEPGAVACKEIKTEIKGEPYSASEWIEF